VRQKKGIKGLWRSCIIRVQVQVVSASDLSFLTCTATYNLHLAKETASNICAKKPTREG
jgi:hypothetical protein